MRAFGVLLCCALAACSASRSALRYVPAEQAAWFKFGDDLPTEGRLEIPGGRAAAMQIAMNDFVSPGVHLPSGPSRADICVHQPQSWDVETAPRGEETLLVRISLSPGARYRWAPPQDMAFTFTVDLRSGRLQQKDPSQAPPELPAEGRLHVPGNVAAAIQLAMEDFLPMNARPPAGARAEEACLYQRPSYDVTAAPGPEGVVQVRFAVDEAACPTQTLRGSSPGLALMDMTVYAIEIRTMRILAIGSHAHLRLTREIDHGARPAKIDTGMKCVLDHG